MIRQLAFVFTLAISLLFAAHLSAQEYIWARDIAPNAQFSEMAVDPQGNVYVAGQFGNTLIFGNDTLVAPGLFNILVVKYDFHGQPVWARQIAGGSSEIAYDMHVDYLGNLYIAGMSKSNFVLGGTQFNTNQYGALMLVKMDPNGNVLWAKNANAPGANAISGVTSDTWGNVYITGVHTGALTGDITLPKIGIADVFVAKFSPSGTLLRAQNFGYPTGRTSGRDVAVDAQGNYYVSGWYDDGLRIGTDTLTGVDNGFVAKFDSGGNFQWSYDLQGPDYDLFYGMGLDAAGNVYVAGDYEDSLIVDGVAYPNGGQSDILLVKLDPNGQPLWTRTANGIGKNMCTDLSVTPSGDCFLTGQYGTNTNFSGTIVTDVGIGDSYIAKYTTSGNLDWIEVFGNTGFDRGTSIYADGSGAIWSCGRFDRSVILGRDTLGSTTFFSSWHYALKMAENVNYITGTVWYDDNGNNQFDAGEDPAPGIVFESVPGQALGASNGNGEYVIFEDLGNYTVSPINAPPYYTLSPASHAAAFNGYGQVDSLNHFALDPMPGQRDVRIRIYPLNPARPGFNVHYRLVYENIGTDTVSGTVTMRHDTALTLLSATPNFNAYSRPLISWNYSQLLPRENRSITITTRLGASFPRGDSLWNYAAVSPFVGDLDTTNNRDTLMQIVTGSYDPNDKLVFPSGNLLPSQVANGQTLRYRIRFQNTGTDTAFIVRLIDTLSLDFNLNTFRMLGASHPYSLMVRGRTLEWRFDNILLPDSNTNAAASHGFVEFSIEPVRTLVKGDRIENFADIYFDYNLPVRTPTASTLIDVLTGRAEPGTLASGLKVWPNPGNGIFHVSLDRALAGMVELRLLDVQGRLLKQQFLDGFAAGEVRNLDLRGFDKGLYFLALSNGNQVVYKRIVLR